MSSAHRPPDDAPRPDEVRLSGAIFLNNLTVYRERIGPAAVDEALARLRPDDRAELEAAVAAAWLRASACDAMYTALGERAGRDPLQLYGEIVREGVRRTLTTLWRVLLRLTTDRALVQRAPQIYAKGHSRGALVVEQMSPGRAELIVTGWPEMSIMRMHGVAQGIAAVLEVAGRTGVEIDYERRHGGARFTARWG